MRGEPVGVPRAQLVAFGVRGEVDVGTAVLRSVDPLQTDIGDQRTVSGVVGDGAKQRVDAATFPRDLADVHVRVDPIVRIRICADRDPVMGLWVPLRLSVRAFGWHRCAGPVRWAVETHPSIPLAAQLVADGWAVRPEFFPSAQQFLVGHRGTLSRRPLIRFTRQGGPSRCGCRSPSAHQCVQARHETIKRCVGER